MSKLMPVTPVTPLAPHANSTAPAAGACDTLTVLYDGACPLCRREVALYRGLPASTPIEWLDVGDRSTPLAVEGDRAAYLARFHVRQADGRMLSGARAFIALWAALPGWRWLARAGALPGVAALMELSYRGFLHLRPSLQRLAAAFEPAKVPDDLVADIRSDHAGETGAVWIYRGVLAVTRDAALRDFAQRHLATEQRHREEMDALLPWVRRSRLLVPWRAAGFVTGALPSLFGARAVYGTIAAVETFVDHHYQQQIDRLEGRPEHSALRDLLKACQDDECEHRDEAMGHADQAGWVLRTWCAVVGSGSAIAVHIARRI